MFGIHGGAEWPGGTYDKLNNQIILPTNHYPWIIRTFYTEKKKKTFYKFKNFFSNIENHKGYSSDHDMVLNMGGMKLNFMAITIFQV